MMASKGEGMKDSWMHRFWGNACDSMYDVDAGPDQQASAGKCQCHQIWFVIQLSEYQWDD